MTMPAKRKTTMRCPQQLAGIMTWCYHDRGPEKFTVQRAVLRTRDELAIDCDCGAADGPPYPYTIHLHRKSGDIFTGTFTGGPYRTPSRGSAACKVMLSSRRVVIARGWWYENGNEARWVAELRPAKRKARS
jgi:hypothetical protein